jgi:hypothetical protein
MARQRGKMKERRATIMSNPARKLARQQKRNSPEGKEQQKQEQAEKKAATPQQNSLLPNRSLVGNIPPMRIRQRRSGSG